MPAAPIRNFTIFIYQYYNDIEQVMHIWHLKAIDDVASL